MSGLLNQCGGCLPETQTVRRASFKWNMRKPRDRKDLSRLYGMEPVPVEIYDTIMRADNGQATDSEHRILKQYIKEKTSEIKLRKIAMGFEGGGGRKSPGRRAENSMVDLTFLSKFFEDEDDYE